MNNQDKEKKAITEEMFEVGVSQDLQEKYGLYAENRPIIHLDPAKVPEQFHPLIPLAEKFGIADDIIRGDFLQKTSVEERENLMEVMIQYNLLLDDWLAGPEASNPDEPSDEYVAFTCLSIASDEAEYC